MNFKYKQLSACPEICTCCYPSDVSMTLLVVLKITHIPHLHVSLYRVLITKIRVWSKISLVRVSEVSSRNVTVFEKYATQDTIVTLMCHFRT